MSQPATQKVPFNAETIEACICPACQVQQESKCVKGKVDALPGILKKGTPNPADVPAVYCSTGRATCKDIDLKQDCICPTCAVFEQYTLDNQMPLMYYCRDGKVP